MIFMRLVMKFGGSSISKPDSSSIKYGSSDLSTEERINNVVNIIKNYSQENELVVVVSAMSNVTNMLVDIAKKIAENVALEEDIKNFVGEMRERHRNIANNVVLEDELDVVLIEIERLCKEMEKILIGILYVGDLTPRLDDYVVSFGERFSATIISGALKKGNIKSKWLTGFEAGIITTSDFGKATPRWDLVNKKVPKALGPSLEKGCVSVVTGFIAGDAIDGCGVYPAQEKELVIKDVKSQYDECARLLKQIPAHINLIICPGNHDAVRIEEPQPALYKDFAESIYDLSNVTLVSNPALVNIHSSADFPGFDVLMYHGHGFHFYVDAVDSLRKSDAVRNPKNILKFLLQKRHIAPTHASTIYVPNAENDTLVSSNT